VRVRLFAVHVVFVAAAVAAARMIQVVGSVMDAVDAAENSAAATSSDVHTAFGADVSADVVC